MEQGNILEIIEAFRIVRGGWRAPKTVRWYYQKQSNFAQFLEDKGLPTRIEAIRPEHVSAFFQYLREQDLSVRTLKGYWTALDQLFKYYLEDIPPDGDGRWLQNPVRKVPRPQSHKRMPPEALTDAEFQRLLDAASNRRDYAILATLGGTGVRAGELVNLQVEDVDLQRRRIYVRHAGYRTPGGTKQNCERFVPLTKSVQSALADYLVRFRPRIVPEGSSWLFAKRDGEPLSPTGLYRLVNGCMERAGIRKRQKGPHLLRRTFASKLRATGIPMREIAELMGHSDSTGTIVLKESYFSAEANEEAVSHVIGGPHDPFAKAISGSDRRWR